eukprot:4326199-Amphidinium_carterae.2
MASSIDASWAETSDPERQSSLVLPLAEQQPGETAAPPAVLADVSPGEPAETEFTAPMQPLTEGFPSQESAAESPALADEPGEPVHRAVGKGAAWWFRPAWPESIPCVLHTQVWKPDRTRTSLTCVNTGSNLPCASTHSLENRLGSCFFGHHTTYR